MYAQRQRPYLVELTAMALYTYKCIKGLSNIHGTLIILNLLPLVFSYGIMVVLQRFKLNSLSIIYNKQLVHKE